MKSQKKHPKKKVKKNHVEKIKGANCLGLGLIFDDLLKKYIKNAQKETPQFEYHVLDASLTT